MPRHEEPFEERPDKEREEDDGWYFELPSGAWERQRQVHQRLREQLLQGEAGKGERVERDPFTGLPVERPKGLFGRFRRKKPRLPEELERELKTRQRERGKRASDDDWSTEGRALAIERLPDDAPLLVRRSAPPPPPDEEAGGGTSKWEQVFGGLEETESPLEAMRRWARGESLREPPEVEAPPGDEEAEAEEDTPDAVIDFVSHELARRARARWQETRASSSPEPVKRANTAEESGSVTSGGETTGPQSPAGEPPAASERRGLRWEDAFGAPREEPMEGLEAMRRWARGEPLAHGAGFDTVERYEEPEFPSDEREAPTPLDEGVAEPTAQEGSHDAPPHEPHLFEWSADEPTDEEFALEQPLAASGPQPQESEPAAAPRPEMDLVEALLEEEGWRWSPLPAEEPSPAPTPAPPPDEAPTGTPARIADQVEEESEAWQAWGFGSLEATTVDEMAASAPAPVAPNPGEREADTLDDRAGSGLGEDVAPAATDDGWTWEPVALDETEGAEPPDQTWQPPTTAAVEAELHGEVASHDDGPLAEMETSSTNAFQDVGVASGHPLEAEPLSERGPHEDWPLGEAEEPSPKEELLAAWDRIAAQSGVDPNAPPAPPLRPAVARRSEPWRLDDVEPPPSRHSADEGGLREDEEQGDEGREQAEPPPEPLWVPAHDRSSSSRDEDVVLRAFEAHAAAAEEEPEPIPEPVPETRRRLSLRELLGEDADDLLAAADDEDEPASFAQLRGWTPQGKAEGGEAWAPAPAVDAPVTALGSEPEPDEAFPERQPRRMNWVREVVEIGLVAVLLFLTIRATFQNFQVDGSSMYPTLVDGEFLLVNKLAYQTIDLERLSIFLPFVDPGDDGKVYVFGPPQRGDIVVFRDPTNPSVDLIKRIIALPGEKVEIIDGKVYINDRLLEEPYVHGHWFGNRPAAIVPEGHYFVLGDNRDNSKDSRSPQIGYVPEDLIIGKATVTLWPRDRFGLAPNDGGRLLDDAPPAPNTRRVD